MQKQLNTLLSEDGTRFCCIYNHDHAHCWLICTLHLLHSSKTLTKLIHENSEMLKQKYKHLFNTLIEYNELSYTQETEFFNKVQKINETFVEDTRNIIKTGYRWNFILNSFYLPIIYYELCKRDKNLFFSILVELSIEPQLLITPVQNLIDIFDKNPIIDVSELVSKYIQELPELINGYSDYYKDKRFAYRVVIMEMYKDGEYSGHVVAMISNLSHNQFYVLDKDDIRPLVNYLFSQKQIRMDRLKILFTDEKADRLRDGLNDYFDNCGSSAKFKQNNGNMEARMLGGDIVKQKMYSINLDAPKTGGDVMFDDFDSMSGGFGLGSVPAIKYLIIGLSIFSLVCVIVIALLSLAIDKRWGNLKCA